MSLIPWNPLRDIDNAGRDITSLFDFPSRFLAGQYSVRVDVYQTDNEVIVKAEIPGVSKKDLDVYIDENSVSISGQTKKENQFKDENAYRTERYYGNFSRTISLPAEVKCEQAKAEYKDGILSITVPKVTPSKIKARKVDIQ